MFDDVPKAPGGGTWIVENDRGDVETSWDDCRSSTYVTDPPTLRPNNLLRCRLFWKHLSSYTPIRSGWKCDGNHRVFKYQRITSVDECFERCLGTPDCHYLSHRSGGDQFCVGCSKPSFVPERADITTYSVDTPFDPPLVGLSGGDTDLNTYMYGLDCDVSIEQCGIACVDANGRVIIGSKVKSFVYFSLFLY